MNRVFGSIIVALGLVSVLTPRFILPVCEYHGKSRMACSYMGMAEMVIGSLLVAAGVAALLSRGGEALKWLMFVSFFGAGAVISMPSVIGYCPSYQMPCHYGTVPLLRLLGLIMAAASAAGYYMARKAAPALRA